MRTTIDFGIDLGTTNSSIAVMNGTNARVLKNHLRSETTPSAVWIDKSGALFVGKSAYERIESDPGNAASEFKLGMGTPRQYAFERGRSLTPPHLSAEVLKALRETAMHEIGEDVQASVITVPAGFELPQCDATQEAAKLAGFVASPLLQEPVAAALAYGYESEKEQTLWLVYDFGGGTFDAAVIQLRDESIRVVNHAGDNHLGGKLIDWAIVEEVLIPEVVKRHHLADFKRGNRNWMGPIAKLKMQAEQAKIRLSSEEKATVFIEYLCPDGQGKPIEFEYELTRATLTRLAEPFILRSINLCKKVLSERRLDAGNVEKLILIGGPTLTPYLRARVQEELRIPLVFDKDPMTVVAQGAAVFARTQRLTTAPTRVKPGQFLFAPDYRPVSPDMEPLVGGTVSSPESRSLHNFTIEFINVDARPQWRSGKIGLAPNGTFMTQLWSERGRENKFVIELRDATGSLQQLVPDSLSHTVGIETPDPPLIHSVGVALANNTMEWLLEKGTAIPARKRVVLRSAVDVRRGQSHQVIRIPVMEGQNDRADRNQEVGRLEITATQVKRDIPAGSEVEFTIEIDSSRLIRAKAYLPILDEEFEEVLSYEDYRRKAKDTAELKKDTEHQRKRLEEARAKASDTAEPRAAQALQQIDGERMVHDVESALSAAQADPDAADKAEKRLLDLRLAIDEVEEALEWPLLVAQAERSIELQKSIIADEEYRATHEEKNAVATLEREIRNALPSRDADLVRAKVADLERIGILILLRHPGFWVGRLQHLERKKHEMTNAGQADVYITQGHRAINNNDFDGLKAAVQQLAALLPLDDSDRDLTGSTVHKMR